MLNKAEKRVRNMGKGELFKKCVSAIIALIFLLNTCSSVWAREGNYGDKSSFEMFANGMAAEMSLAVGCFNAPFSAGFGSIASDLAGLTLYYTSYETYNKPWIHIGNMEISKSQVISTAVGIGASALGGYLDGALSDAISDKVKGKGSGSKDSSTTTNTLPTDASVYPTDSGLTPPSGQQPLNLNLETPPETTLTAPDTGELLLTTIPKSETCPTPFASTITPPPSSFFNALAGWLKHQLTAPTANPYYRYGKDGNRGAAALQLTGDLAIGFGKLLVHEFIKDNLVEGISIKTKKGKKLIETKPMDETEADIIASTGTYAFSLAFTPFVRGALGRLVYGKGNFAFGNQLDYLSKKNAKYADPNVTYGVDKNNDGTVDCETETFSPQEFGLMIQNGEIKSDTKVIRYDKDGINTEMTGAELTPIFQDPYVVLAIGSQEMQTMTVKGIDDKEYSVSLTELGTTLKLKDKTAQKLGEKEGVTYSLKDIDNKTITVSGKELDRVGPEVYEQLKNIDNFQASPMYWSVLATTGGFLNDVHGNPIDASKPIRAGLKTLQAAGLSPFVGAAVKVGMLRLMKYHTHYGSDDERIYENTLKMAAAEAAGNIVEAVVRNSNPLSAWYAGTVVRDASGEKLYVNSYAQRGHTGSLGEEYRRLVGKEIANQAFLFGSEWAWAAYCKQKGIQPDVAYELMHLAASSVVSGLVDAAFRADPGKAKKEQVFIHDSEGDRFIDRDELTKSNGEFVIKGVDGEEKPVTIKAFADKDVVFIDGKGNVYLNPKTSDIENKFLVNVSLDKKNESAHAGAPVSYDISIDVSSKLSDHFFGGKLHATGYRNTETGAWISNETHLKLRDNNVDVSNYKEEAPLMRFARSTLEDFNNYLLQAAVHSGLYVSPEFSPGTGLGAFMAQQYNQESWIQYIAAVGQGASPILVAANRMAGNMRYFANANLAESFSAAVTNPFIKNPDLRSYAAFIPTAERLKFMKNLAEQKKQQDERAIADMDAFMDAFEKYGKDKEGKIKKLDDELKSLREEIEALEEKKDDLEIADIVEKRIGEKKEEMTKLEGAVRARDFLILQQLGVQGYIKVNKIYISSQEAYEDIFNLLPKVKAGLEAEVKSLKTQIKVIKQSAGVIGILGALPFIGAFPQAVFLSNVALATKGDSEFNDWIIGGIVDYNVSRAFETNAPMSEYMQGAMEKYINDNAQKLGLSEDGKKAFMEAMAKADQKTQMLQSTYFFSVAGVYQGSETYANVPLLTTAGNITSELNLQLKQVLSTADTPLIVDGEINNTRIREAFETKPKDAIRAMTKELLEIELDLAKAKLTAEGKDTQELEKKKEILTNTRNYIAIQEWRKKNPELAAFTWLPGDDKQDPRKTKEAVLRATRELNSGRMVYSDYGLTERTTVDQFGRAVETQHFAPEFIDGKFQTARQDIVTKHYYGPFGHAVSKTVDYTQIRLPDAEAWPVELEEYKATLGDAWDKLAEEFSGVMEPQELAKNLGIIEGGAQNKDFAPEDLKDKFIRFLDEKLEENPSSAIDNFNADVGKLAANMNVDEKTIGGDFSTYIPRIKKFIYKTDSTGKVITDQAGHPIPKGSILNEKAAATQRFFVAAQDLLKKGAMAYSSGDKENLITARKFSKEEINEYKKHVTEDMLKEFAEYTTETWGVKVGPEGINKNTPWFGILAYLAVNEQFDGRTWSELEPEEKKKIFRGAIGWRLLTYDLYANDGVKQTIPNNQSSLTTFLGSGVDQLYTSDLYLPVIAGQKMAAPPTVIPGPEYQPVPVSVGPNTYWDTSLYSTQGGNSAYAGPTGRASLSDINSGPQLLPYTQYSVPSVERKLGKLIQDYAETKFTGTAQREKLVKFLKDELRIEDAEDKVNALSKENYTRESLFNMVAQRNASVERTKKKLDEIAKSPPQFKKRVDVMDEIAQVIEVPKTQFKPNGNLVSWAISRLGGQKEIVDAVANKQSELETALSRDLYNVKQYQFYRYENIGNREIPLPTWGGSTGYGLVSSPDNTGNLRDNRFMQQLRFDKGIIYIYNYAQIKGSIDDKRKEATTAGNKVLDTMLAGITIQPVAKDISLANEPDNKDILGATYERTTEVFPESGSEGYISDNIGSTDVISRSMLDEDAITKEINRQNKKAERKAERKEAKLTDESELKGINIAKREVMEKILNNLESPSPSPELKKLTPPILTTPVSTTLLLRKRSASGVTAR